MSTAASHLLEILNNIFNSIHKNPMDEKSCFRHWIKKWITGKDSVCHVFCDNNNPINNDNFLKTNEKQTKSLQLAHNKIKVLYSQCYLTYNYIFISDLLFYISTVYYDFFNSKSEQLRECIKLLEQLKQNMFYEDANDSVDVFPNVQSYRNKFENYGRSFMQYFNFMNTSFINHCLSKDPEYQLELFSTNNDNNNDDNKIDSNNNHNNNKNKDKLKFKFYNFIKLIISNNNNDEWLRFLHGPILNNRFAMYHHQVFCNKYQKDNIWSYDIKDLIDDILNYLKQINDCIFHEKYMEGNSEATEICFPKISQFINNNSNNNNNNNNNCHVISYYLLPVMARDVVELDAVVVEVVEDGQAPLVALAVVRLGTISTEKND